MDIKVSKPSGESFNFEEYGITVEDFLISSISMDAIYDNADGAYGRVNQGATYGVRNITVPFHIKAYDLFDYPLARDMVFRLATDTTPYYVQEARRAEILTYDFVDINEPPKMKDGTENEVLSGKRYLVRLSNTFEIEQMLLQGSGELIYETVELPFSESVGTTQDPLTFNAGVWQFGQGLIMEETNYTHDTNEFRIYNAGDVAVEPTNMPMRIIFNGASNNLTIINHTTGESWQYNGSTVSSDEIVIDGIRTLKNGVSVFGDTNKRLVSIEPGWNDFEVTGATDFTIEFVFRFYYK